jgi:hypothetical protein
MADATTWQSLRCARLFRDQRRDLLRQALVGEGPLLEQVLALREGSIRQLRQDHSVHGRFVLTLRNAAARGVYGSVSAGWFSQPRRFPLPLMPKDPRLDIDLGTSATEWLVASEVLAPVRDECVAILARSHFRPGGPPYRASYSEGGMLIEGQDGQNFLDLTGVAHELGHCLAERNGGASEALSEAVAIHMETAVAEEFLQQTGRGFLLPCWEERLRRIEETDVYFCKLEFRDIVDHADEALDLFPIASLVFRESLFTLPGYQSAYVEGGGLSRTWRSGGLPLLTILEASDGRAQWSA